MQEIKDLADFALEYGHKNKTKYIEARAISGEDKSVGSQNGEIYTAGTAMSSGIGIRVLVDGGMGFASTSQLAKQALEKTIDLAIKMAKVSKRKVPLSMGEPIVSVDTWKTPFKTSFADVDFDTFLTLNKEYTEAIKRASEKIGDIKIPNSNFFIQSKTYEKYFVTSEGTKLSSHHEEISGYSFINAQSLDGMEQRFMNIKATGGWEYFNESNIFDEIEKDSIQIAYSTQA